MSKNEGDKASHLDTPEKFRYSRDHAWVDASSSPAPIGITEYAAEQLGELVFIDLPETGGHVHAGDEIAELESSKAVEPLVCPVSGTIAAVNRGASDDPKVINDDPYGEGWIVKVKLDDDEPDLLSAKDYAALIR